MEYVEIDGIDYETASRELASGEYSRIERAILRLSLSVKSYDWAESICLKYLDFENLGIRQTAVRGLGNLARVSGKSSVDIVVPSLLRSLDAEDQMIRSAADDALNDVLVFIHPDVYVREDAVQTLLSGTLPNRFLTLFDVARRDVDYKFACETIAPFCESEQFFLRGSAVLSLGEVVANHSMVAIPSVDALVQLARRDDHWWVRETADSIAEFIAL